MKYMIDQDALIAVLKSYFNESLTTEQTCKDKGSYELAMSYREQRYLLGNLLLMIEGNEHLPPSTIDKGGFMKPVTNIRAAVNSMTDEELAEVTAPFMTVTKDGNLRTCEAVCCSLNCPVYDCVGECEYETKEYMLKEAE